MLFRSVQTAADADEALTLLRSAADQQEFFDIALIDHHMPQTHGIELGKMIRADARFDQTRLVLLSSVDSELDLRTLREAGYSQYELKPVRQSRLALLLIDCVAQGESGSSHTRVGAHQSELEAELPDIRHLKLLVAEDNEVNQIVMSEMLAIAGCEFDLVQNGREAVDAVRAGRYDVLVMDCEMPEMDGLTATREIRDMGKSDPKLLALPIIALTATAESSFRAKCLEAGMTGFCAKPVTAKRLFEEIQSCSPLRSVARGNGDYASDGAPIDLAAIRNLCLNRDDAALRALDAFESQLRREIAELRKSIEGGDRERIRFLTHSLMGAAKLVGAERLAKAIEALQVEFHTGATEFDLLIRQLEALADECLAFVPEVTKLIQDTPAEER